MLVGGSHRLDDTCGGLHGWVSWRYATDSELPITITIMVNQTPRLGLDDYDPGDTDWDHSDLVQLVEEMAIDRGPVADRPAAGEYDDELFYATDQKVLWGWDAGSSDWTIRGGTGSESQPLPSVHTDEVNNVLHVPKFGTIQEAHDALPSDGGTIVVDEDHAETGITLTKPVSLRGSNGGFFGGGSSRDKAPATVIDVSGGDGILVDGGNITLRDLRVEGDKTGGYGVQIGTSAQNVRGFLMENVSVQAQGTHGIICRGEHVYPDFKHVMTQNNVNHGFLVDVTDYWNAASFGQFVSQNNGGDGFHVTGLGNAMGMQAKGFVSQKNDGYAIFSDNNEFNSFDIRGYGFEGNGSSLAAGETTITLNMQFSGRLSVFRSGNGFSDVTRTDSNGSPLIFTIFNQDETRHIAGAGNTYTHNYNGDDVQMGGGLLDTQGGNINMRAGQINGNASNMKFSGSYLGFTGPVIFNGETRWNTGTESETADSMTANPETDTEDGYIQINVNGSTYQIPIYSP